MTAADRLPLHLLDRKLRGTALMPLHVPAPITAETAVESGTPASPEQIEAIERLATDLGWTAEAFATIAGSGYESVAGLSQYAASWLISYLRDAWASSKARDDAMDAAFRSWLRRRYGVYHVDVDAPGGPR